MRTDLTTTLASLADRRRALEADERATLEALLTAAGLTLHDVEPRADGRWQIVVSVTAAGQHRPAGSFGAPSLGAPTLAPSLAPSGAPVLPPLLIGAPASAPTATTPALVPPVIPAIPAPLQSAAPSPLPTPAPSAPAAGPDVDETVPAGSPMPPSSTADEPAPDVGLPPVLTPPATVPPVFPPMPAVTAPESVPAVVAPAGVPAAVPVDTSTSTAPVVDASAPLSEGGTLPAVPAVVPANRRRKFAPLPGGADGSLPPLVGGLTAPVPPLPLPGATASAGAPAIPTMPTSGAPAAVPMLPVPTVPGAHPTPNATPLFVGSEAADMAAVAAAASGVLPVGPAATTVPTDLGTLVANGTSSLKVSTVAERRRNPFQHSADKPEDRATRLARTLVSDMIAYKPAEHEEALRAGAEALRTASETGVDAARAAKAGAEPILAVFGAEIDHARTLFYAEVPEETVAAREQIFVTAVNELLGNGQPVL